MALTKQVTSRRPGVRTVLEQITTQLRSEIIVGHFRPHQRLHEVQLAKRFGVSRSPIRQVLQRLALEGLVNAQPNRGARVAASPPEEVRELLLPVRAQIETYALRRCFKDLCAHDFDAWEKLLSRWRLACQEQDYPASRDYDTEFHRAILRRADLEEIVPIWTWIAARSREYHSQAERQMADLGFSHARHVA